MNLKKILEIGDVIYGKRYDIVVSKTTILKTTKTMAISKDNRRFQKDIEANERIRIVGQSAYHSISYYLETKKLKEEYFFQVLLYKIENVKWKDMDINILKDVYAIIDKSLKKKRGHNGKEEND